MSRGCSATDALTAASHPRVDFPGLALSPIVCVHRRVNEAHGASERFRAALEASAERQHRSRCGAADRADGTPGAETWGSVWKALIRVHSLMMLRVRHVVPAERVQRVRAQGLLQGTLRR